jgi:four helix bundle protein
MQERPYQKLIAWKESHELCVWIYGLTKSFPSEEKFALCSQMRRAAYSVPMNIAEGNARRSKKEHVHFLEISIGSLEEVHYQCILAHDLQYIDKKVLEEANERVQRISFLLQKLRSSLL